MMTDNKQQPELHMANDEQKTEAAVKPWIRLGARYIDLSICSFIFALYLEYFYPTFLEGPSYVIFGIMCLFLWIFIETLLLTTWGSTPGKWLLNIEIRTQGDKKPGLLNAFRRSIKVWFFGLGIGIPFITVFTLFSAYFELNKNKTTTWDRSEKFMITYHEIGTYRAIVAAIIIAIPIVLNVIELYSKSY